MNYSIEDYKLLAKHLWKPSLINHPIIQADSFLSVQMDAFTVYRYAWENRSVLLVVAARPVLEGCSIYQQSDTDTLAHLAVLQMHRWGDLCSWPQWSMSQADDG